MNGYFYCFISSGTYHRFIPYTPHSLAYEIGFSNFSSDSTTIHTQPPFDIISNIPNPTCALTPYNQIQSPSVLSINKQSSHIEICICGTVIAIGSHFIDQYYDTTFPCLFSISNPQSKKLCDYILCLPPNQNFDISLIGNVKTIISLSNNPSLQLNAETDTQYLNSESTILSLEESTIKTINNLSDSSSITRFTLL